MVHVSLLAAALFTSSTVGLCSDRRPERLCRKKKEADLCSKTWGCARTCGKCGSTPVRVQHELGLHQDVLQL